MNPALDKRYVRCPDFETRVAGLEFTPEVWAVFARLEQPCSAQDLAGPLQLAPETILAAFDQLAAAQLIRKQAMGWNEFAATAHTPPPAATAAPASPPAPAAAVSLRLTPAKTAPQPFLSLRVLRESAARPATAANDSPPWKLKPVLDAIAATAGGGIPGQLLVYKIFLQLPPELLKAANLDSPAAVADHHVVSDPRLRDALVEAARVHAQIDPALLPIP